MKLRLIYSQWLLLTILVMTTASLSAQTQNALDIALRYLEQNRKELKLTNSDLTNLRVSGLFTSRHNGVTHLYLTQQNDGIDVYNGITGINILPNGKILNMSNRLIPDLANQVNATRPGISAQQAVEAVIQYFHSNANAEIQLQNKIDDRNLVFTAPTHAHGKVEVTLVYELKDNAVVHLAWQVKLEELDQQNFWNVRVDALNGNILDYQNQVIHCSFGHPDDICFEEHQHDHQPKPAKKINTRKAQQQNTTTAAANTYRVFPLTVESPNHGDHDLITSPSNMVASPFGWHDTDGTAGAEYTITRGNNVHAYNDIYNINQSIGDEPEGGPSLDFDYPFDPANNFPYTQIEPAVVNLFYWNNLMHDVWYQYGFDEAAGNFQANNYGNGGLEGDYMMAEAFDGSRNNNASFSNGFQDGTRGRIQMHIWSDEELPDRSYPEDSLVIIGPDSLIGKYPMEIGGFGGALPDPAITSEVVLVNDMVDVFTDACDPIVNGADLAGKIAMIDRGNCQFGTKSLAAQNEGAIAVIVCNNVTVPLNGPMGGGVDGDQVNIPVVLMSLEDCDKIKVGLPGLMVEFGAAEFDYPIPTPGPSGVTGDFDNGVIAHEYTHGISIRLVGGPDNGGCLSNFEQAGEGWSDWFALVMASDENNFAGEKRGIGTYVLGEPISGDGIRTYAYSHDMNVNPHTYADILSESVPHGVGSVWAVMIWDLYWDLIEVYGYDSDIYNGTGGNNMAMQLVMDGLKLGGCNPDFIDNRDAILAADEINYNGANQCLIWETFARRGLGANAVAGGNEDFSLPESCLSILKINKTASVEEVEAGGIITYTLEITNDEPMMLSNVTIADQLPSGTSYVDGSSSCANASVDDGVLTIEVGALASGGVLVCTYQLQVDVAPFSFALLEDGMENGTDGWLTEAPVGPSNWEISTNSYEGTSAWYAEDVPVSSDQILTLADTFSLTGTNPGLAFWHAYNTEATWDGGVVEISTDYGDNWEDLGNFMTQNGYDGNLEVNPASPISGRAAFHGDSDGYIQTLVDLSSFSGQEVMIRFRLGCDGAEGGDGWYIDNVEVFGELYIIKNIACISSNSGAGGACSEVSTFVVEGPSTSLSEPDDTLELKVFPNPSSGNLFVEMTNTTNAPATLEVFGLDGRLLLTQNIATTQGTEAINLNGLTKGMYLLKIQTAKTKVIKKIVIQ